MNRRIYGYLRASTDQQDASRAKTELTQFADRMNFQVACWFEENESGVKLDRPELLNLLKIALPGDIILVEQIDRLSRLNAEDWEKLKHSINSKGLKVVSLDLPTSHQFINSSSDPFTERMLTALNGMMLDMLAAIARKDYDDRRRRQAQGVQRAKREGKYKGRPIDQALHGKIQGLLIEGKTYNDIQSLLGCSRHTIAKCKKAMKAMETD